MWVGVGSSTASLCESLQKYRLIKWFIHQSSSLHLDFAKFWTPLGFDHIKTRPLCSRFRFMESCFDGCISQSVTWVGLVLFLSSSARVVASLEVEYRHAHAVRYLPSHLSSYRTIPSVPLPLDTRYADPFTALRYRKRHDTWKKNIARCRQGHMLALSDQRRPHSRGKNHPTF